jgi:hypothetical protein
MQTKVKETMYIYVTCLIANLKWNYFSISRAEMLKAPMSTNSEGEICVKLSSSATESQQQLREAELETLKSLSTCKSQNSVQLKRNQWPQNDNMCVDIMPKKAEKKLSENHFTEEDFTEKGSMVGGSQMSLNEKLCSMSF